MTLALVFNHNSLPCSNVETAQQEVERFIKLALTCRLRFGFEVLLVDTSVDKTWFGIELAADYFWRTWFEWAKRQPHLTEFVTAFRSLQTRQPMLLAEDASQIEHTLEVGLIQCQENLNTLRAAYWHQTFLISFPTNPPWNQPFIDVWVRKLRIDGDLDEQNTQIGNLFDSKMSLVTHNDKLLSMRNSHLQAGKDMWGKRAVFFPKLCFLDNPFGSQLRNWSHRTDVLSKARETLSVMNEFVSQWQAGAFMDYRHEYLIECGLSAEVSGESPSVANDPSKRNERMLWLPHGEKVYFENHVKLPASFRLHFYPSTQDKLIYIGYLGPHLSL